MSGHEPFLREIVADPDHDMPRLVYADWLEECGDIRGEFIRLQCTLARSEPEDAFAMAQREVELLREHADEWLGPLASYRRQWIFRRGFVEDVDIRVSDFLHHGDWLFAHHPVRLASFPGEVQPLAQCPHLARLRGLRLRSGSVGVPTLEALFDSPHFPALLRLDIVDADLGNAEVTFLAESRRLAKLVMLDLSRNQIRNDGLAAIANSPRLPALAELELRENEIRLRGAQAVAQSPYLQKLQYVGLIGNPVPQRGIDLIRARFGRRTCVI